MLRLFKTLSTYLRPFKFHKTYPSRRFTLPDLPTLVYTPRDSSTLAQDSLKNIGSFQNLFKTGNLQPASKPELANFSLLPTPAKFLKSSPTLVNNFFMGSDEYCISGSGCGSSSGRKFLMAAVLAPASPKMWFLLYFWLFLRDVAEWRRARRARWERRVKMGN